MPAQRRSCGGIVTLLLAQAALLSMQSCELSIHLSQRGSAVSRRELAVGAHDYQVLVKRLG